MDKVKVQERVQDLTDLELAALVSLVACEHCIIETTEECVEALDEELQLIAANTFGLSSSVINCSPKTTWEDFTSGILIANRPPEEAKSLKKPSPVRRVSSIALSQDSEERKLPNIVIAKNLNFGSHQIQIQALELIRTKRMLTHTGVYSAPKTFLIIALTFGASSLVKHLSDQMFLSHFHDPEDGFANLEEGSEWVEDDKGSSSSVVHKTAAQARQHGAVFEPEELDYLIEASSAVAVSAEVKRYIHNVLTFLRLHRAVGSGISPRATQHFHHLVKCLAPLHGLTFVTPSLVALAARKIYRHRIVVVAPEDERSMQYGSDLAAVTAFLEGITPEHIIEEVLTSVETPV